MTRSRPCEDCGGGKAVLREEGTSRCKHCSQELAKAERSRKADVAGAQRVRGEGPR